MPFPLASLTQAIPSLRLPKTSPEADALTAQEPNSFGAELATFFGDTVGALSKSEKTAAEAVAGRATLQDVALNLGKAETMLQTVVALRDRIVTALQEIAKMPI